MKKPFVTASEITNSIDVLFVKLEKDGFTGRAETLGVDYLEEDARTIRSQIERYKTAIERGITRQELQELLPPGGARNGIDCAMWDLEAKEKNTRVWEGIGLTLKPVETIYTLSSDTPQRMADEALRCSWAKQLKLKLNASEPAEKLLAVRTARPDAELIIDANSSWSSYMLDQIADTLSSAKVQLLEQPLPSTENHLLTNLDYPIPICADESFQSSKDLSTLSEYFDVFNVKLDKCGGLTDALEIARWCKKNNKKLLVGNMLGSSLAMAPGFVVAQYSDWIDLDGPLLQKNDVDPAIHFDDVKMTPPEQELWG